jgi:hypothetical protein
MRFAAAASGILVASSLVSAQQPAVDDVLAAGRKYVAGYLEQISGTLLEERYTLVDSSSGRMDVPTRISSDLYLMSINGSSGSLRDAFSINGAKIREAQARVDTLLAEPTAAKWEQARAWERESHKYFMAEIVLHLNDPLTVLNFMTPPEPQRFTYSLDGRKKMDGAEVVGLRFEEKQGDTIKYVLGTRYNAYVSGKFWLEPATGVIHQTELYAESKYETGRTVVTYKFDKALNIWLPSKSVETYQERADGSGITGMGAGGTGRSFRLEANASYANPRRTSLSKAR